MKYLKYIILALLIIIITGHEIIRKVNIENKLKKLDENKSWIYNSTYETNYNKPSYKLDTNETIHSNKIIFPYINIDSLDASNINKEIKELLDNSVSIFNKGIKDKTSYVKSNYSYKETEDYISLLITYETNSKTDYLTYTLSLKDGSIIPYKEIIKTYGYTEKTIEDEVKEQIKNELKKHLSTNNENVLTYLLNSNKNYKNDVNNNKIKYFIDDNNNLNIFINLNTPIKEKLLTRLIIKNKNK